MSQQPEDAGFLSDEEKRRQQEERESIDSAIFGMENTAGTGSLSVEVTKSNRSRFVFFTLIVGVLAVALVMCIAVSVATYLLVVNRKATPEELAQKKAPLPPPKEQKARIKDIDVEQQSLRLLVGLGKYQSFDVTGDTILSDANGNPLKSLAALEEHKDEDVMILMTEDRQGLQWLKLMK